MKAKRFMLTVAGLLGAMLGGAACGPQASGAAPAASFQEMVPVRRGDLEVELAVSGEVTPVQQRDLFFDMSAVRLLEVVVEAGDRVQEGRVLARVDPADLEREIRQGELEVLDAELALESLRRAYQEAHLDIARLRVASAEAALASARAKLQRTQAGSTAAELSAAEAGLQAAQEAYEQVLAHPAPAHIEAAKRKLDQAKNSLWAAQTSRDSTCQAAIEGRSSQAQCENAEAAVLNAEVAVHQAQADHEAARRPATRAEIRKAESDLARARSELEQLRASPTPAELAAARAEVARAQLELRQAQADLADLEAGPDPLEVRRAEVRLEAARAGLEQARRRLEGATLRAPLPGTILEVHAQPGDLVSVGSPVVTLANLTDFRIEAAVAETDLPLVRPGQAVEINVEAFPGATLEGTVLSLPPRGRLSGDLLVYDVPVAFDRAALDLRPGMTAGLRIRVGRAEDALLVPASAVRDGPSGSTILVAPGGEDGPVPRPVKIGLSDGVWTEVVEGLREGEQVILVHEAPSQAAGFFGFQGRPGRGFDPTHSEP